MVENQKIVRCQLGFWGRPYIRAKFYCQQCGSLIKGIETIISGDEYIAECYHEHELIAITLYSLKTYDVSTSSMTIIRHVVPEKELPPEIMIQIAEEI
ncbi:MAG: hypothetical protein QXG52_06135 [Candidatus Caldarchaeum sp.]